MSRLIVTIHGNPGSHEDLDAVVKRFNVNDEVLHFQRPETGTSLTGLLSALDSEVAKRSPQSVVIVAYSWGCFLALQWARQTREEIEKIFLINPTLSAENTISNAVKVLSNMPLVGSFLLNKVAASKTPEFIKHSFAPQNATAEQERSMMAALNNPNVWKGAIHYKIEQQQNLLPLNPLKLKANVVVIRGVEDKAISWDAQKVILDRVLSADSGLNQGYVLHEIESGGHALPWTHVEKLAEIINESLLGADAVPTDTLDMNARIGYQPGESVNNNITCYLERHLAQFPDRRALCWVDREEAAQFDGNHETVFNQKSITYAQFGEGIHRVAKGLSDLGITKGDRVILFLPMGVGMYTAMCAIQRIGAIAVFLDSWARRTHLGASAACVTPKAMISHKAAFDLVAEVSEFDSMPIRIIAGPGNDGSFTAQLEALFQSEGDVPLVAVESEYTALITFTTGSSGTPKGANRTHRFLAAQHEALFEVIPYDADDSDMPAFPIFSLNNLASGVTTILPAIDLASPNSKDPAALVSQILHEKITCTTLSPSTLNGVSAYCAKQKIELPSLRRVVTGGAPISKDNVKDFKDISPNAEIWILYGSTEVEPMAHIEAKEMLSLAEDPDPEIIERGVNVGHVSDELRFKFIKPTAENIDFDKTGWDQIEVPEGQVGEFIVTGDHVCQDYYNNPEAFFKTKIKDDEGSVWHRTGDLAFRDKDGYLWIVGRIHNMIDRAGEYFFPVSAEIILKRLDFVKRGAFLGFPDEKLGERTAVAIELTDDSGDTAAHVKEVQRVFAKNKITLDSFYVVDSIPMDPRHHSKVEYGILREKILSENIVDSLA